MANRAREQRIEARSHSTGQQAGAATFGESVETNVAAPVQAARLSFGSSAEQLIDCMQQLGVEAHGLSDAEPSVSRVRGQPLEQSLDGAK